MYAVPSFVITHTPARFHRLIQFVLQNEGCVVCQHFWIEVQLQTSYGIDANEKTSTVSTASIRLLYGNSVNAS